MPFYLNIKRNGSIITLARIPPSFLSYFLSFFPFYSSIPSRHPSFPPSLPHPVHPLPPIAFLSYRKSKRLTCKWGLLNPNRPSVTSQQREGGGGGEGRGGEGGGAVMIWERDNQSEINWEKEGLEGKKVVKEMLFFNTISWLTWPYWYLLDM